MALLDDIANVITRTQMEHFADGVRYALTYLRDEVYGDEITETAIWRDFFGVEEGE